MAILPNLTNENLRLMCTNLLNDASKALNTLKDSIYTEQNFNSISDSN